MYKEFHQIGATSPGIPVTKDPQEVGDDAITI